MTHLTPISTHSPPDPVRSPASASPFAIGTQVSPNSSCPDPHTLLVILLVLFRQCMEGFIHPTNQPLCRHMLSDGLARAWGCRGRLLETESWAKETQSAGCWPSHTEHSAATFGGGHRALKQPVPGVPWASGCSQFTHVGEAANRCVAAAPISHSHWWDIYVQHCPVCGLVAENRVCRQK